MRIINWNQSTPDQKSKALERPKLSRCEELSCQVRKIIHEVRSKGDEACYKFTESFDGVKLDTLVVAKCIIEKAAVAPAVAKALEVAKMTIVRMQTALLPKNITIETVPGMICQRIAQPLDAVGLYVPGGTAPLVSTLMMLALPAKIAGCQKVIVCTPPNRFGEVDPAILYAAKMCGITELYTLGGAQAIAAMAYGTETVPKVNKILGPGNAWVTAAKQVVTEDPEGATVEFPAGPSELMVIADSYANSTLVAADLLSQAEHDANSHVMLCTTSMDFAQEVNEALQLQLKDLPRKKIAEKALSNGKILIVRTLSEAVDIANNYAPEHLSLQCVDSLDWISQIRNAGAVFVGSNAAEAFGDYVTGSNHVLPTYGYARSFSGLSVCDFLRFMSVQSMDDYAVHQLGNAAMTLADLEGLKGHSNAIKYRYVSIAINPGD